MSKGVKSLFVVLADAGRLNSTNRDAAPLSLSRGQYGEAKARPAAERWSRSLISASVAARVA